MTYSVRIKELLTPAKNHPTATLVACLVRDFDDGSQILSGAWFGTDREELERRVILEENIYR